MRQYEPEIRRAIRVRLTDPRMRRLMDSMDICQSVLGNFFVRVAAGQFDLDEPEQLIKLLVTMARNKIRDQFRRQHAERRDQGRVAAAGNELLAAVADSADSPSQIVAGHELLEMMRSRLSDEERFLADQRAAGRQWDDIAGEVNGRPGGTSQEVGTSDRPRGSRTGIGRDRTCLRPIPSTGVNGFRGCGTTSGSAGNGANECWRNRMSTSIRR